MAALVCNTTLRDAAAFAERAYPGDRQAAEIAKTAVVPFATTTSGAPAHTSVSDLISILGKSSAAAQLFSRSMQLSFGRDAMIFVPTITASPTGIAFVGARRADPGEATGVRWSDPDGRDEDPADFRADKGAG